jgi:hypothetical protein
MPTISDVSARVVSFASTTLEMPDVYYFNHPVGFVYAEDYHKRRNE